MWLMIPIAVFYNSWKKSSKYLSLQSSSVLHLLSQCCLGSPATGMEWLWNIKLENWIEYAYFFQYFFHLRFDIFIGFFNFQEGRSFKGVLAVEKFGVQRNFLFPADAELLRKIL